MAGGGLATWRLHAVPRKEKGPIWMAAESYRRPRTRFVLVSQSALFTCDGRANILRLLFRLLRRRRVPANGVGQSGVCG